jgi:hypothetical protein
MPTEIVLSNGQKVSVVESPVDVEAVFQLSMPVPKRLNRSDSELTGVWINPAAVVYFYDAGQGDPAFAFA